MEMKNSDADMQLEEEVDQKTDHNASVSSPIEEKEDELDQKQKEQKPLRTFERRNSKFDI